METLFETLEALRQEAESSDDDAFREAMSVTFVPVTEAELAAVESHTGLAYPRGFRAFISKHGLFRIGDDESSLDGFALWPPLRDETSLLDQLKRDYDADDAAEVAENIGLDQTIIDSTAHALVFATTGFEDYWVFDTRVDQGEDGRVTGLALEDDDLTTFAERPEPEAPTFPDFIRDRIQWRRDNLG